MIAFLASPDSARHTLELREILRIVHSSEYCLASLGRVYVI
jgi:hypothetical protein